jgi:molybdopterin-containing oxidoreductase family iron-sulfur binding subunit
MKRDDMNRRPAPPQAAPRWWRTLDERADFQAAAARDADEFPEELPVGEDAPPASRRDFFKVMGLSATAALAACQRAPQQKILPYTYKPDEITPGTSLWYATLCGGCSASCGLLVKTRDGRPIKIEGNPSHPVSRGAVCAVGQASLLGLYDDDRARGPRVTGAPASWKDADAAVAAGLARARAKGAVRVVAPWGLGPTAERALDAFLTAHEGARVVRFDPMGQRDAIAAAHEALYDARLVPDYRLDAAHVVVAFDADFLGTFLAPAAMTRQWSAAREPARAPMLRHVQIEATLSLTGGAADERVALAPSALVPALTALVRRLAAKGPNAVAPFVEALLGAQAPADGAGNLNGPLATRVAGLADELRAAGAHGLVMCGSDDPMAQLMTAVANALLENTGTTVVLDGEPPPRAELALERFVGELAAGTVGAVVFLGTNPALVDRRIAAELPHVPFSVSTSERLDETAALTTVYAPQGHFLEAWTDHRPRRGVETMGQPCVGPLFDTRAQTASLLAWAGAPAGDYDFLRGRWRDVLANGPVPEGFDAAFDSAVREGVVVTSERPAAPALARSPAAVVALARLARAAAASAALPATGGLELVLHASVALLDGAGAASNNGWLQELPDPITKVAWGNVAAVAPSRGAALGLADGDLVELRTGAGVIQLPVLLQPGLPPTVVAVAVGHGRAHAGRHAAGHGADAWPLADVGAWGLRRAGVPVTLRATGARKDLALAQTHASQEGRELVRQADLTAYREDPRAGNEEGLARAKKKLGLWPGHAYDGHRWALSIDLNKCTGCAACVVSCSAENNIPIVGELEVQRRREMHWLRIDRYYGGEPDAPEVVHQPMMCQHCENAPCETVCPVVATVHSSEGLNQQVYNRCVGTRYCANNCPTKVRHFNWFDYDRGGDLARMALNPDVVVRSRGVMEKCSMCVQRIEEARAEARREGRALVGGDIATACQQSCPAQAITFGDANDAGGALSRLRRDERSYAILEEINVKPQVTYMTRIRNRGEGPDHG